MLPKALKLINTILYIAISLLLVFFSILLIFISVYNLYLIIFGEIRNDLTLSVLQSAGAVIIGAAILDVAKYMYEEGRVKTGMKIGEARETLTKIIVIISIAVAIEGLIYIFKAGIKDIQLLIYPSLLLISSTIMIVGLGMYYKLTSSSNKK